MSPTPPVCSARDLGRRWAAAAAVAGLGTALLFDAVPGINWALWTAAAVVGLCALSPRPRTQAAPLRLLGAATVVVAGAAAVTSSTAIVPLIVVGVLVLLAVQVRLAAGTPVVRVTPWFAATTPVVVLRSVVAEAARSAVDATARIASGRARAWVRGLALTTPVLLLFTTLLAGADPTLEAWVDAVGAWAPVPRGMFFAVLLGLVLGAFGAAQRSAGPDAPPTPAVLPLWIGATERAILFGGVGALFWGFLALQLSYLFGVTPHVSGSGVTFAEYARRGFAELTVVATATALLVVGAERVGAPGSRTRLVQALTAMVLAAVALLLASALRRVWLYEAAYGHTTARLYAQAYMAVVAVGLVLLARELAGPFDEGRLFRRAAGAALAAFVALGYWNHEGWIARRNLERAAVTGTLDVPYLTRELSPDALPAIADGLPRLATPLREDLRRAIAQRYAGRRHRPRAWFEWNLAASRAQASLAAVLGPSGPATSAAAR